MTTNSTLSLLPSSRAITWHSFVTRLSQILLTCAWSAIASDFKVVVESLRGVWGHQNTPLWLLRHWVLDNNIVPLRERGKGRIGVHGGVSAVSLNWVVSADGLQCETIVGKWDGKNYTVWLLSPAFRPMYPVSRKTWGLGDCMRHNRGIFYFLPLFRHCTGIRQSSATVSQVKTCLNLLPQCDSAFHSIH